MNDDDDAMDVDRNGDDIGEEKIIEEDLEEVIFDQDAEPLEEEEDDEDYDQVEPQESEYMESHDQCFETEFTQHSDSVYSVGFLDDNAMKVLSGAGDGKVCVWNSGSGDVIWSSDDHTDSVIFVRSKTSSTEEGKLWIASASLDHTIRIYSCDQTFQDFKHAYTLEGPSDEIQWICFHETLDAIMAGSADTLTWLWDLTNGDCVAVFAGHEDSVLCGQFTPNGKRAITSSADGTTKLWNPSQQTNNLVHSFSGHDWHSAPIVQMVFYQNTDEAPIFVTGAADGRIIVCKLDSRKVLQVMHHNPNLALSQASHSDYNEGELHYSVESLAFCGNTSNPASGFLVSGGTDGFLRIWDWKTGSIRHTIVSNERKLTVVKIDFVENSYFFVAACANGKCSIYDTRTGVEAQHLTKHGDMILDFQFKKTPEKYAFVSACDDHTCRFLKFSI